MRLIKKIIFLVPILIFIVLAYVVSHVLIYLSLIEFFAIKSILLKNILLWSLVFLYLSFLITSLLAHFWDGAFSRRAYFLACFWMGLVVNLVLFLGLAWLFVRLSFWFHGVPNEKILASSAIFAALAYSIYGVWNAFVPRVTKINIAIDSLPKKWVGKKIVHISDVHMGHIYRQKYLSKVVETINSLNPEIVAITGDLFDATDGSQEALIAPLNKINAKVFFATGNHEVHLGLEKAYGAIAKTKLIPLRDSLKIIDGLQFVGIEYPLRGKNRDISKLIPKMEGYDQFAPSVLLIHEPVQIENAKKIGISLQLSGHTHVGQLFPFGVITRLVFGGYNYGFKREGSYAIYVSSGLGGWGPPMRTEKKSQIVEITLL